MVLGSHNVAGQLIKIVQAKAVGAVDNDSVCIWNVETAFNDGSANKHIDFSGDETRHHFLELVRIHLAVTDLDPRLGNKIDNAFAHALDGVDAVMQKINLTLTFELTIDRVPDNSFVVTADDRFYRQTVERWRLDRRHVFDADERKIKRARNWRGRKREHVDELEKLLEFFLMQNAKALLFIDHGQAEIFKNDVPGNQAMGADDDVDTALTKQFENFALLTLRSKAAQHLHSHRIIEHPLTKNFDVLFLQP